MRKVVFTLIASLALGTGIGLAQENKPKKTPKNEEEAKLINQVVAEGDAAKRLAELDDWSKQFPESDWNDVRPMLYLITYQQLGKSREAFDKAVEMLGKNPNDFNAWTAVLRIGPELNNKNPSPADLDQIEKVAEHVMSEPDKVFADSNKPDNVSAGDWAKVRPYWYPQSRVVLIAAYTARKDEARMEAKLKEKAAQFPNDPLFPLALINVYFQEIKAHPDDRAILTTKQPLALYYYARAAQIDGPLASSAADKQKYMASFTKNYKTYHGSDEGMNDVIAMAKTNPVPPDSFKIKSTVEIAQEKADQEAKDAAANPAMALWKTIKTGLTGDNPDQFFDGSVKDAALPGKDPSGNDMKWKARIVELKPATRPKTLILAIENANGDVTLNLDAPLPGKMDAGESIEFQGVAKAYQKEPYMLTLETEKDKITGWTGKNAPATKKGAGTAKKKAQ